MMAGNDVEDHHSGLAGDLQAISARLIARRRALGWLTSAGATIFVGGYGAAGGGPFSPAGGNPVTGGGGLRAAADAACIAGSPETRGPYPADGTNRAPGATSNALAIAGILRSDIRRGLLGSKSVAAGVPVSLTIEVVDAARACAPLSGYAIYLWQCDRGGGYSLYDLPAESYLRGLQVTDRAGRATFTTIFPGCYGGRYPHIHFELFRSLDAAAGGRNAALISQFAMPRHACAAIYGKAPGYDGSIRGFADSSTSRDYVFGDNDPAQIAQQTPALTGSISAGYAGRVTIGVKA